MNCSSIMEIPLKSSLLLLIFAAPLLAFSQSKADYTIPVHGEARGLPHVEIEIRQDLLLTSAGQKEWAERIAAALRNALRLFQSLDSQTVQ